MNPYLLIALGLSLLAFTVIWWSEIIHFIKSVIPNKISYPLLTFITMVTIIAAVLYPEIDKFINKVITKR